MSTNAWILAGAAVAFLVIVVQSLFQFRSCRATLRRQMLWPFTTGAVMWVVFTLSFCEGMICFLSLATLAGIYGPYLFWILKHTHNQDA
jgi:hypothetical protein